MWFLCLDEKEDKETSDSVDRLKKLVRDALFLGLDNLEQQLESTRELSRDPDTKRNVTELITSKGYSCEDHIAQTQDGYLLSLQRVGQLTTHFSFIFSNATATHLYLWRIRVMSRTWFYVQTFIFPMNTDRKPKKSWAQRVSTPNIVAKGWTFANNVIRKIREMKKK